MERPKGNDLLRQKKRPDALLSRGVLGTRGTMEVGTRRGIVVAMLLAVGADATSLPVTQSLGTRPAQGARSCLPVCWLRAPCATPPVYTWRVGFFGNAVQVTHW